MYNVELCGPPPAIPPRQPVAGPLFHFVMNLRTLAAMCRKKMEAMKVMARTMTTYGSLGERQGASAVVRGPPDQSPASRLVAALADSDSISSTHTCRPASPESVYSLSMVLLDPPAPAARVDVGLGAVGARRLKSSGQAIAVSDPPSMQTYSPRTHRTALAPGGRATAEDEAPPPVGEDGRAESACAARPSVSVRLLKCPARGRMTYHSVSPKRV